MVEFTQSELRQHAMTARREVGPPIAGQCDKICERLGELLCDHGLPYRERSDVYEVRQRRLGPGGRECHFICSIPGEFVAGAGSGERVWVDPSLDQFCDENKEQGVVTISLGPREEIDPVYIYMPGDSRRSKYKDVSVLFDEL